MLSWIEQKTKTNYSDGEILITSDDSLSEMEMNELVESPTNFSRIQEPTYNSSLEI